MKNRIFSFFSGVGLLDLGFENNDFEVLEAFEIYEPFLNAYKYSRRKMDLKEPKYGYSLQDIGQLLHNDTFSKKVQFEINDATNNGFVGFIGGPPCPDFSIAGKNKGYTGDNGRLTKDYFKLIVKEHPDFFLFENVKGLWSTKKHREFFDEMLDYLKRNGYILSYRLVNTLDYGVPQKRERIILIGIDSKLLKKRKITEMEQLWKPSNVGKIENQYKWPLEEPYVEDLEKEKPINIIEELTVEYWFKKNDVINHYNSLDYFQPRSIEKFKTIKEGNVSGKSFKRLHRWRYSPTAAYGNNEVHLHPYKSRRISVSEALAVQSAPKSFVVKNSLTLTDKFKCIGNAVPYNLSYEIAKRIKKLLN